MTDSTTIVSSVPEGVDPMIVGILHTLWQAPPPGWVSLPRLSKRLGASGSEVLRHLTLLSSAQFGDRQGYGWVVVKHEDERWMASLSEFGRAQCDQMFVAETPQESHS